MFLVSVSPEKKMAISEINKGEENREPYQLLVWECLCVSLLFVISFVDLRPREPGKKRGHVLGLFGYRRLCVPSRVRNVDLWYLFCVPRCIGCSCSGAGAVCSFRQQTSDVGRNLIFRFLTRIPLPGPLCVGIQYNNNKERVGSSRWRELFPVLKNWLSSPPLKTIEWAPPSFFQSI